ncbi:O-antigen ligase family protein [Ectothiorhodospira mobilis]|uniref:O-antigen ligase family protein n=1 Tax=Ectothiorhodospira mobilis TaxID=195064 RepID=UPI001EE8E1D1|nr:O-antigen ligase family protein [Ectothiorhodospira mobilis]MCG5534579.1 O-antigen ligase family protein [Ectothiorhodospira mobilis]
MQLRKLVGSWVGLLGLVVMAGGFTLGTGFVNSGLGLMLVGVAFRWSDFWSSYRREPFLWWSAAMLAYLVVSALWVAGDPYGLAQNADRGFQELLIFTGLPTLLVGMVLGGSKKRIALMVGLFFLALLIPVVPRIGVAEFQAYWNGQRADFEISVNGLGVYFSLVLLALVAFLPTIRSWTVPLNRWLSSGVYLTTVILALICLMVILFTQSRSVWLGLLPVLFVLAMATLRVLLLQSVGRLGFHIKIGIFVMVLLIASLGHLSAGVVKDRLTQEQATIQSLAVFEFDDVERGSIGYRVRLWMNAGGFILEKPFFGWGPGSASVLIEDIPELPDFPHFHNLYLQLLVEIGIVGFLIFLGLLGSLIVSLRRAYQREQVSREFVRFFGASGAYLLLISLAQVRHDDSHGTAVLAMLSGLALTARLMRKKRDRECHET